jgi:hypothetical protein
MKALRDIGYPYPIDAHSLYPVDFAAIQALLRSRTSRRLCSTTLVFFLCFARRHVPNCVLTIAGFGTLPISPGRLRCFCLPYLIVIPNCCNVVRLRKSSRDHT